MTPWPVLSPNGWKIAPKTLKQHCTCSEGQDEPAKVATDSAAESHHHYHYRLRTPSHHDSTAIDRPPRGVNLRSMLTHSIGSLRRQRGSTVSATRKHAEVKDLRRVSGSSESSEDSLPPSYQSVIVIGHTEDYHPNSPPNLSNDRPTQPVKRRYFDDMNYQPVIVIGRPDHDGPYLHTSPDHAEDSQMESYSPSSSDDDLSISHRSVTVIGSTDHYKIDVKFDFEEPAPNDESPSPSTDSSSLPTSLLSGSTALPLSQSSLSPMPSPTSTAFDDPHLPPDSTSPSIDSLPWHSSATSLFLSLWEVDDETNKDNYYSSALRGGRPFIAPGERDSAYPRLYVANKAPPSSFKSSQISPPYPTVSSFPTPPPIPTPPLIHSTDHHTGPHNHHHPRSSSTPRPRAFSLRTPDQPEIKAKTLSKQKSLWLRRVPSSSTLRMKSPPLSTPSSDVPPVPRLAAH